MKLEVGMYVRTDTGIIEKLEGIHKQNETNNTIIKLNKMGGGKYAHIVDINSEFEKEFDKNFSRGNVIKSSHSIIDLIQVGDYVNGCYVSNKRASVNEHLGGHPKGIGIIKCNAYFNQGNYNDCKFEWIEKKDIKSIVTKEQFENMSYRIEDEE